VQKQGAEVESKKNGVDLRASSGAATNRPRKETARWTNVKAK